MEKFKNGDVVAFVGDSITHDGRFISHIVNKYKEIMPTNNIRFYNCGVAGASIGNCGFHFFEDDVIVHNPSIAILMFGMNDSCRFALDFEDEIEKERIHVKAIKEYTENLDKLVKMYLQKNTKVVLCTPTPYDEFSITPIKPLVGGYALIEEFADIVRKYAKENDLELIDYSLLFKDKIGQDYIKEDHVHPNDKGHFTMAKYFLSLQGIELTEKAITKYVKNWHEAVQIQRDILAVEFIVIGFNITNKEEKINKCKNVLEDPKTDDYIRFITERYLNNLDYKKVCSSIEEAMDQVISSRD